VEFLGQITLLDYLFPFYAYQLINVYKFGFVTFWVMEQTMTLSYLIREKLSLLQLLPITFVLWLSFFRHHFCFGLGLPGFSSSLLEPGCLPHTS